MLLQGLQRTWFFSLLWRNTCIMYIPNFPNSRLCQLGFINPSMTNLTSNPINEDVFQSLFYPIGGIPVLIVTFLSLTFHLLNLPLSFIIIDYENNINRHATLLTKLQTAFYINTVMFNPITFTDIFRYSKTSFASKKSVFFCENPVMKALTSRFSTGIQLNSHFCTVYNYFEYFCVQVWLYFVVLESIVQYIFTKNVTFLLVVKEDLLMAILWFSVLGTAACSTFMKFNGRSTKANISKDTGTIFRHLFMHAFSDGMIHLLQSAKLWQLLIGCWIPGRVAASSSDALDY